jgi:hypothetical protein
MQLRARRRHRRPADAFNNQVWRELPETRDELGGVMISADLSDSNENPFRHFDSPR